MTILLDPSLPVNRVRLTVGDSEIPFFINDTIIEYLLDTTTSETEASVKALEWIIASLAKDYIDQETDEVSAKYSQVYDNFRQRYKDLTTNPSMMATVALPIFGGTSKMEMRRVRGNSDSNCPPVRSGSWDTSSSMSTNYVDNYFFVDEDSY